MTGSRISSNLRLCREGSIYTAVVGPSTSDMRDDNHEAITRIATQEPLGGACRRYKVSVIYWGADTSLDQKGRSCQAFCPY